MNTIKVLDCTLRDGGYCNQWEFGYENIGKIINGLIDADIDLIECGYLTNRTPVNRDSSKFVCLDDVSNFIPQNHGNRMFVVMMNWDEYDVSKLPHQNETLIDGIRVAFHKEDLQEGLKVCAEIKKKGYKVFVQAMVSLNYSDREFLGMIEKVNELKPFAFYIVDSFGVMKKKSLMYMLYMIEKNLSQDIWIGFHSHNNLQLAYANAQSLVDMPINRNLIIDTSVYGMGRGAGNLNTELFVEYLNENYGREYLIKPLLKMMDETISVYYEKNPWGYSLPNYLSAIHNVHPNYASFLDAKKTLTVREIDKIFSLLSTDKRVSFDQDYVETKYIEFLGQKADHADEGRLQKLLQGRKVLLIAPGKSAVEEKEKIFQCVKDDDVITISVNFDYADLTTDFVFLSNLRRYREMERDVLKKCIITSNIPAEDAYLKVGYKELLNEEVYVQDNAGLLLIKLLMKYNAKQIYLAGFDGYAHDETRNYAVQKMQLCRSKNVLDAMNLGMSKVIKKYAEKIKITFLTEPKYVRI